MGSGRRGSELEPLAPNGEQREEPLAFVPTVRRFVLPPLFIPLVVLIVPALVVVSVIAVHFERQSSRLRGQLWLAQQTKPNLGQLAYDGGAMLVLPSPTGTAFDATVTFVSVRGAPQESVWVLMRAAGLDPATEFDLETQSCDGQIGLGLDRGGSQATGATVYRSTKLGVPPPGRSANVVVRRFRGDPVAGLTISSDKTVRPMAVGRSGC